MIAAGPGPEVELDKLLGTRAHAARQIVARDHGILAALVDAAQQDMMTIVMIAMCELHEELGEDLAYLEPRTLIGALTRVTKELVEHVRKREVFAETWLKEKSSKVIGATPLPPLAWRKRAIE